MRPGSLCLEPTGPSKGPWRKTKALSKEPTPLVTWEKRLAGGGGLGILVFAIIDLGKEEATPI